MGLLEKLWDDTIAGPQPDSDLGRLRKFDTLITRSSTPSKGTIDSRIYFKLISAKLKHNQLIND